ncbi:uncharacterized protein T551_01274 [Pneumocystis jirovecii RU7]|uniref:Importin N-terminal domain-containing protein n=1 Tax=Pneumocystis jirovecii (strain RU7) TaxID=1408657 RepID=A0A0W4ZS54_PNEJ7|nr:uncharacterized protein T551_01274 [Pneumocystis jirovecii RU7]KTW31201.1 hypothetical protein T551_01274 [Pneumocystis jirovecii RU7]
MEKNLHQIFIATLSSDPNIRKGAESQLKQYSMASGFIGAILDLIATNDDISIKQAASIYLKNRIGNAWERNDSDSKISEDDKHLFRKRLLPTLLLVPPIIHSQIISIVGVILSHDFPEKWSDFMDQVVRLLNSQDAHYIYIGLISFLEISKVYRYRSGVRRQPFDVVVQTVYPRLLEIGDRVASENDSIAGEMLKIIFKSYKFYITLELSPFIQDSIVQWVTLFLRVIIRDLPIDIVINNLEEREHHSWWKAKKWAYSNLNCLFMRYGEPSKLFKDTLKKYKFFAKMFSENFVPEILKVYLQQVELWSDGKIWISKRCLCSLSIFFEECVFPKSTWTLLKSKCSYLISHFIFPLLCITNSDIELWNNDPVEYIHKNTDIYDNFHSPAVSATSFFIALVDNRKKFTFMEILEFINDILNTYQQTCFEERNSKEKEGVLRMIGSISHVILAKNSPIIDKMENFFVIHVFPEFWSPYGYLRARACEIMTRFADIQIKDQNNIARAYEGIITCFHDPELPVRLEAACALQPMIQHEYVRKMVVSRIPQIIQQLLDLINELDIDTLTTVMEKFVEVFSEELIPFSVQLTEQLRDTFLRIMHESDTYVDQNSELVESNYVDDKSMILMGILNTVATLILNLEKAPEVLFHIINIISPVIVIILETASVDLYAEIFEIINNCIFSVKKVSPIMWNIYELLYKTFKNSGIDYIDEIFPVLDNYILYGREQMISNPSYLIIIYDIIETIFTAEDLTTQDKIHGCKLIESVFFNLKGHVDHHLHSFVKMAMNQLMNDLCKSFNSRIYFIEVIISAIYYNSLITLQYLENCGWIEQFFNFWFSDIDRFSRVCDKKLSIVAICSFLSLSIDQIPKCIQKELSWIFREQLKLFQTLPQAIENRETMERLLQDDSEGFSKNENWNDDTDDVVDEDADKDIEKNHDYLNSLSQEDWLTLATNDDNYTLEEEPYDTLLDKINVYVIFKDLIDGMQQYNQAMYNEITKDLSQEHYLIIQTIINQAYASSVELK